MGDNGEQLINQLLPIAARDQNRSGLLLPYVRWI